jgi:hypothetical protein
LIGRRIYNVPIESEAGAQSIRRAHALQPVAALQSEDAVVDLDALQLLTVPHRPFGCGTDRGCRVGVSYGY